MLISRGISEQTAMLTFSVTESNLPSVLIPPPSTANLHLWFNYSQKKNSGHLAGVNEEA